MRKLGASIGKELGSWDESIRLTHREAEVLRLSAYGHSEEAVARALRVTRRTVDRHLSHVYEKLGVVNRVQAILAVGRLGLVPDDEEFRLIADLVSELRQGFESEPQAQSSLIASAGAW